MLQIVTIYIYCDTDRTLIKYDKGDNMNKIVIFDLDGTFSYR